MPSPYTWSSPDYAGNVISVTFNYDNITLILGTVNVTRDTGCMYRNIYFGLGADGTPDTTAKVFGNITGGQITAILGALLGACGFTTITDVLDSAQITAGP